jgi:hypothetical protein
MGCPRGSVAQEVEVRPEEIGKKGQMGSRFAALATMVNNEILRMTEKRMARRAQRVHRQKLGERCSVNTRHMAISSSATTFAESSNSGIGE